MAPLHWCPACHPVPAPTVDPRSLSLEDTPTQRESKVKALTVQVCTQPQRGEISPLHYGNVHMSPQSVLHPGMALGLG